MVFLIYLTLLYYLYCYLEKALVEVSRGEAEDVDALVLLNRRIIAAAAERGLDGAPQSRVFAA